MSWLTELVMDNNSIAHAIFLYALVIAFGVILGKIKIFGVSLGVTFVLFVGILVGHLQLTVNTFISTGNWDLYSSFSQSVCK